MASSTAESGEPSCVEVAAGPVELTRTVEWVEQGAIVTFELTSEDPEPTRVHLEQDLPSTLPVSDAGFRQDAEPAEWAVTDGTVSGTGAAPTDGTAEFVLGMKFDEPTGESVTLPEPALCRDSTDEDDSGVVTDDGGSGALAETVREVIESVDDGTDAPEEARATEPGTGTATDGGRWQEPGAEAATAADGGPAPRDVPNGPEAGDLEAAVAAVETELDEAEADDDEAAPALDLADPGDVADTPEATDDDADGDLDVPEPEEVAGEGAAGSPDDTGAAERSLDDLAARLAAADETDRRAVREALELEPDGTVAVRLRDLESRLSAFEAYEDALAEFIDDAGTAAEVREAAETATGAVEALREDVAAVESDLECVRETAEAARAAAEAAREEREALREDLTALREDVDEAATLRTQLLDALREPDPGTASAD